MVRMRPETFSLPASVTIRGDIRTQRHFKSSSSRSCPLLPHISPGRGGATALYCQAGDEQQAAEMQSQQQAAEMQGLLERSQRVRQVEAGRRHEKGRRRSVALERLRGGETKKNIFR